MQMKMVYVKMSLAVAASVLFGATAARANSGTWNSSALGSNTFWTNSLNWSASPYPAGTQIATFNNAPTNAGRTTLDLSGLTSISNIIFDTSAAAYTIGSNGVNNQTLVLFNSGVCQMTASAVNSQRFDAALQLGTDRAGATYTFINSNLVGSLTFAGNLLSVTNGASAGTKALVVSGIGNTTFSGNILTNGFGTLNTLTDNSIGKLTLSGSNIVTTLTMNGGPNSVVDIGSGSLSLENAGGTTLYSTQGGVISGTGRIRMSTTDTIANTGNNYADCYIAPGKTLVINPEITGKGGFEMWTGAGTFVFNGINTFEAHVIIGVNNGTISVSKIGNRGSTTSNLGMGTNFIFSGSNSRLLYTGAGETSDRQLVINNFAVIDQSGAGNLKFSAAPTVSSGSKTLTLQGSTAGTGEFGGVLANSSGTLSVTKAGSGTWLFSTNNTYTGATTVSGGTLGLTGANGTILSSGGVTLANGGTLLLDNTATANNTNRLSNANTVTMNGGTLRFSNSGGAASYLEVAGPLSVSQNANTIATVQAASGQTATLTFASLARTAGATLNFTGAGLGGADGRNKILITAQPNGLIGPWATVNGTSPAAYSTTLGVYAAPEPAYNQEISALGPSTITDNPADYVRISTQGTSGDIDLSDALTRIAALTQNTVYDATIKTAGKTLQLAGIAIPAGKASVTVGAAAGDGTLAAAASGGDLALNNAGAGALTVNAAVANNGGASTLTKTGSGPVTLASSNTFSGVTTIAGGALVLANGDALQNSTLASEGETFDSSVASHAFTLGGLSGSFNVTLADNAGTPNPVALSVGKNTGTFSGVLSGGGSLTKIGTGTLTLSGSNTFSGGLTVSAGTVAASSAGALGTAAVVNNGTLNLTGASDITYTGLSAGLSGAGTNNVTVGTSGGTVYLNGDYSGFTGVWNIGTNAAAGASKVLMNGADNAAATLNVLSNATFFSSLGTHYAAVTLRGGDLGEVYGQFRIESGVVWAGPVTLAGDITAGNDALFGSTSGNGTIAGVISDLGGVPHPVAKTGAGSILFTGNNTYGGQTWIRQGTLYASSLKSVGGGASALGAPATAAAGTIRIGNYTTNAVLTYFGTGDTSDRIIDLAGTTGGATLDQSGTNALTLTGGMIASGAGSKTLTLQGSTIGTGEFAGVISNGVGSMVSVTKAGSGTWALSGDNTYTGGTTMSSGTLVAKSPKALGTGWVGFPITTATLDLANDGAGETPYSFTMNGGTVATLKSNVATPGAGINHNLGELWLSSVTVIVTNGENVVGGTPSLTVASINLWSGAANSTSILIPTTADLYVGGITIYSNNFANKLIQLDGTSPRSAVTGSISNGLNSVLLTKANTGTWTLYGSNTYSGATAANGGRLVLTGPDGAILGSSGITLSGNATLLLASSETTNNINRLSDTAPLTMNGGVLNFFHTAGATNYSETAGPLAVSQGSNALVTAQADSGYTSAVTFASFARTGNGTVKFMGTGLGLDERNQVRFTSPPTLVNGIIGPWATVNGTDLATYGTYGVTAYAGGYADVAARGPDSVIPNDATAIVRITADGTAGAVTLATSPTNSLYTLLQNNATVPAVVTTTNTLLLASGILIGAGQESLTIGVSEGDGFLAPLTPGGNLLLANNATSDLTVNAPITNNASASSLTKSGPGTVRLTGAPAHTGPTTIAEGTLTFASSAPQTLASQVSGPGGLTQEGTNRLTLTGANTYEGLTTVSKGIVLVTNNTSLGSAVAGTVISNGATLDVGAPVSGNTLDLGGESFTVGGAGYNGRGAIVNSSATSQYGYLNRITLTDDTTFGGENVSGRWDIRNGRSPIRPTLFMNDCDITKVGSNMVVFVNVNVFPGTGSIDVVQGTISSEVGTSMGGSSNNVMTVRNGAMFDFYNTSVPIQWSLALESGAKMNTRNANAIGTVNTWSGPVTLLGGTAFLTGSDGCGQTYSGPIAGSGSLVKMGGTSLAYLTGTNTYGGTTTISNGTLYAKYAGSLPGYDATGKVTIVGGTTLSIPTGDGTTGWNSEQINALHTNATPVANTAVLSIDATLAPAPDVRNIRKNYALTKQGTNSLTLGGVNAYSGATTINAGTLTFGNDSTNALGAVAVNGGLLAFSAGSSNTLAGTVNIKGGSAGASVTVDGLFNMSTNAGQTITVGSAMGDRSAITFSTNATLGKMFVGNGNGSSGAVIQNSGALTVGPSLNSTDVISLGSAGGYGYYRLNGGSLSVGQFALTGSGYGANYGVADLFSGTVNVGPVGTGNWLIWDWSGGSGVLNLFNSALFGPLGNDISMAYSANKNAFGMLNLLGPAAFLNSTAYGTSNARKINMALQPGNEASVFNLNGGTVLANQITAGSAGTPTYLNLGGGTIRVNAGTSFAATFLQGLTAATVYPGGVTFDTTNAAVTVNQALRAPAGYGVTALSLLSGGTGYIGAPVVKITGGSGTGATAIATVDLNPASPTAGQVTGLTVTSPGFGYQLGDQLFVALFGGGFLTPAYANTAAIGVNAASGGLTKQGSGTLTLGGTNTYGGTTTVGSGTLKLGNAFALPPNGPVSLAGGTLDLNGFSVTNALTAAGGSITNGTLSTVLSPAGAGTVGTLSFSLKGATLRAAYEADVTTAGASDLVNVDGNLNMANLTLGIVDTGLLDRSRVYTLLTGTGTRTGTFASTNLPDARWHIRYESDGSVKLFFVDGTIMLLK